MTKRSRFSQEVRERAVRLVAEHRIEHPSRWAAITSIASKIGCSAQTLSNWVTRFETDAGRRPDVTTDEQARVKALVRDNKELRRALVLRTAFRDHAFWRAAHGAVAQCASTPSTHDAGRRGFAHTAPGTSLRG